jgi:hypothetical protein
MGRAGPACRRFVRYYRNPVFRALFHALPENRLVRDRHTRLAAAAILSRSARRSRLPDLLLCNSGLLIPWFLDRVSGSAEGTWHYGSTTQEGRKDGPHAGRMGRRGSNPGRPSSGRHGGTTGRTGHDAPGPVDTAVMVLPVRAACRGCQSYFRNSPGAVLEHANPRRIDIVRAKWHLLGQLGDGPPHPCRRLASAYAAEVRGDLAPGGKVPSRGEKLDLEVPGEHLDEVQCLGYGLEIVPGPASEGVGRDAERGADGDLAPCEVARVPWR